jgi:Spy/CpxP family protein refolding chaperone
MNFTRAIPLLLVLGLIACDKEKPADTASPTASTTATATASVVASASSKGDGPEVKKPHRKGGRGGLAAMMLNAAEDKVPEAKATVDDLQKKLKEGETPRDEMKTLHEGMVSGIKAGKIDVAKFETDKAAAEKAMKAMREKEQETLNSLHAALKPEQRKAVVAEVRDKMAKRAAKWKDKPEMKDGEGKPDMKKGYYAHLTKDLDLDDAQKKKADAIFAKQEPKGPPPDKEAMKKKMDAFLDAFEKDGFDAKKLEADDDKKGFMMHGPMDAKAMNEFLAVLKPEQRDKLAAKMEKKGGPPKGGPNMAPPAPGAADDDDDDK